MRVVLAFLIFLESFSASAQVTVVSRNNFNFNKGTYLQKSTKSEHLAASRETIQPQTEIASNAANLSFLFPPQTGILLFKSKDLGNPENIAGPLSVNSLVQVDTIFHNQAYRTEDNSAFSFDIVYALTINGKMYFTDFRPTDFIPFTYQLKDHHQYFVLAGQSTGYDMYADKGYPNHFHVAVFSNAGNKMHLFYSSDQLPFDFEKEFWDNDTSLKSDYNAAKKELNIEIEGKPLYKAIWNGQELKRSDL
jgi:hypothetical protein